MKADRTVVSDGWTEYQGLCPCCKHHFAYHSEAGCQVGIEALDGRRLFGKMKPAESCGCLTSGSAIEARFRLIIDVDAVRQ